MALVPTYHSIHIYFKISRYKLETLISNVPIHRNHRNTSPQTCTKNTKTAYQYQTRCHCSASYDRQSVSSLTNVTSVPSTEHLTSQRTKITALVLRFGWDTKQNWSPTHTTKHTARMVYAYFSIRPII
jgi:hypothetical protein